LILLFRLILNRRGKDRSLVALDSSYGGGDGVGLARVGAGEACDLLILLFRLILNRRGKDRSLVALDSSYRAGRGGVAVRG
jgi:hypothetical protein